MWRLLRAFSTRRVLLTGVGQDRIGIITDVSGLIFSEQGNILESCMSKLAGDFAVMMLLDVPEERLASLELKLSRSLTGFNLAFRDVHEEEKNRVRDAYFVKVHLKGPDYPGIMHHFTTFLSFAGISVLNLATYYPQSTHERFCLRAQLEVPVVIRFEDLKTKVTELAAKDKLQVRMEQVAAEEELG